MLFETLLEFRLSSGSAALALLADPLDLGGRPAFDALHVPFGAFSEFLALGCLASADGLDLRLLTRVGGLRHAEALCTDGRLHRSSEIGEEGALIAPEHCIVLTNGVVRDHARARGTAVAIRMLVAHAPVLVAAPGIKAMQPRGPGGGWMVLRSGDSGKSRVLPARRVACNAIPRSGDMAPPAGFEPATFRLEGGCSVH